ncbi:MAG: hypothetical protein WDM91_08945 [Rhizomicrobium sp.]
MSSSELEGRFAAAGSNVFASRDAVERIRSQLAVGDIGESEALRQLTQLERSLSLAPLQFTSRQFEDEWLTLSRLLEMSEAKWKRLASSQFLVGLTALPLTVTLAFGSLLLGWQKEPGAAIVAAVLAGCLSAIAVHSFLILRIHQQAGLAAERLSEKRVGALFLRLAASREDSEEAGRLLSAGTAMFLGHYAPDTVPLRADDFSAAKR